MPEIGIQLYTLRDEVEKDIRSALEKLSDAGFSGVEFAFGFGGLSPGEAGSLLRKTGLECVGIYVGDLTAVLDAKSKEHEYADALECPYLICGLPSRANKREWPGAVEEVRNAAITAASRGRTLLYHNHWHEFHKLGGRPALDILFEEIDSGTLKAELDTGWIKKAGQNPISYINKYAGRVPCLHARDFHPEFEVLKTGEGIVDMPGVLACAKKSGVSWIIFEQSIGTFESARESCKKLSELIKSDRKEVQG